MKRLSLPISFSGRFSKKSLMIIAPLMVLLLFVSVIAMLQTSASRKTNPAPSAQEYRQQLQGQVDSTSGAPRSGRDPAAQTQTSLNSVASAPTGTGLQTDTPAAGLSGNDNHHATSGQAYSDSAFNNKQAGISAAGCYIDYGVQGQECLPSHAAEADGTLTCAGVRQHFPNGIKVTGTDRFKLDGNGDKLACGTGE